MIQEQIAEIFHFPTKLNREHLSFCEANVKALSDWISTLSIMQLGDTALLVMTALHEVSELHCSETLRFDLIQTLHPVIENVLVSLEKNFLNQGLFHSDRDEHIIELTTRLRIYFTALYIDITRRSEQQISQNQLSFFQFFKRRNLKTARTLSTYYALEQLSRLLVQQNMLYQRSMSHQWLMTHYLYDMALKNQENSININQLQGTNHSIKNIDQAYAQVLLLEIFNTNQIRPAEIHALYQCSFDWAQLVQILPHETITTRYVIDNKKDLPPIFNLKQAEDIKPNIYISTQSLLEHINLTIQKDNQYLSRNEKNHLSTTLKFHVQNVLGSSSERQYERYEYSAQLHICFSLHTAHFYLSNAQTFIETLKLKSHYDLKSNSNLHASMVSEESNSIQKQMIALDRKAKQSYQTQVLDISKNGYRILWSTTEAPQNLRTGEFILLREKPTDAWKGGVIRWMKQAQNKSYELGLEVLSEKFYPCAVKTSADRLNNNYHPSFLMEVETDNETANAIILPNLALFKEQQAIYIRIDDYDIKVYLNKTLLITQSFIQYNFELLNREQQSIIDQFIQDKSVETHSQKDVWEALK